MRTVQVTLAAVLASAVAVNAGDLLIQSFDRNGQITFNEITNASEYRVQWAPSPEGVWADSWDTLDGLPASGSGMVTVAVPMVYRVLASISPTGFALIPAGTFTMGAPTGEPGRDGDETVRQVTLTRDFFIQKTEVTNRQMADLLNWILGQPGNKISVLATTVNNLEGNPRELLDLDDQCQLSWNGSQLEVDPGKDFYPCIDVTWYGAQAYCNYLSDREGRSRAIDFTNWSMDLDANGYRLPTEAEWEYACRAGTSTAFYTGDIIHPNMDPVDPNLDSAGWYSGNATNPENPLFLGRGTHWVGQKLGNAWELFDMHGNVREWCWDWLEYYDGSPVTDPTGSSSGALKAHRGGSWLQDAQYSRSADRELISVPLASNWGVGFRPVRTSVP